MSLQAKTLAVSNADSTDDVIRMALLQFGISVSNQRPLLIFTSVDTHFYPLWFLKSWRQIFATVAK